MSKKIIFFLFLIFAKINIALADFRFDPINPPEDLIHLIIWLFTYAVIIGVFILVAILVKAGIIYLTSIGNPPRRKNAIDDIKAGFLGIGLLIGSVLILITINPELLAPQEIIKPFPVYTPPPPPPIVEPIEPPGVYLSAVRGINIRDDRLECPEKREMLLVGTGKKFPFSLAMKFTGDILNIKSCRSLGVTIAEPRDKRFEIEQPFERWGQIIVEREEHWRYWWGWRMEQNTLFTRYDTAEINRLLFMEWGRILYHQDHLKPDTETIEEIMNAPHPLPLPPPRIYYNYNEMPLRYLFGPNKRKCGLNWGVGRYINNCHAWNTKTNEFKDQTALRLLEQIYGRLPYKYVWAGWAFYYTSYGYRHPTRQDSVYGVTFYGEGRIKDGYRNHRYPEKWFIIPEAQNLVFDYPGVYTFKMQCQTFDGEIITAETSVAVFDPPQITLSTPTPNAYTSQRTVFHFKAINAFKCVLEEPKGFWEGIWDSIGDAWRSIIGRIWPVGILKQREFLKDYIFGSFYISFEYEWPRDGHPTGAEVRIKCYGPGGDDTKSIWIRTTHPP